MYTKTLLALALAAGFITAASASPIYNVQETFASGASFDGKVTFSDDLRSVLAVDGQLSGGGYGSDHITWVWWPNSSTSFGPNVLYNFLMDGNSGSSYRYFLSFTWDVSSAPTLAFSNAVNGNSVNYSDKATGGTMRPAAGTVPEPGSIALVGLGLLGFAASRKAAKPRSIRTHEAAIERSQTWRGERNKKMPQVTAAFLRG